MSVVQELENAQETLTYFREALFHIKNIIILALFFPNTYKLHTNVQWF